MAVLIELDDGTILTETPEERFLREFAPTLEAGQKAQVHVRPYIREGHPVVGYVREVAIPESQVESWLRGANFGRVMYHGTKQEHVPSIHEHGLRDENFGIWLTDSEQEARAYANERYIGGKPAVVKAAVRLEKPFVVDYRTDPYTPGRSEALRRALSNAGIHPDIEDDVQAVADAGYDGRVLLRPDKSIDVQVLNPDAVRIIKPEGIGRPLIHKLTGVVKAAQSSEELRALWDKDDPNDAVATNFDLNTVTDRMISMARKQVYEATQRSLEHRGLPDEVTVYRRGDIDPDSVESFSLQPNATTFKEQRPYTVKRSDILVDTNAFFDSFVNEHEVLIKGDKVTPVVSLEDAINGWVHTLHGASDVMEAAEKIAAGKHVPGLAGKVAQTLMDAARAQIDPPPVRGESLYRGGVWTKRANPKEGEIIDVPLWSASMGKGVAMRFGDNAVHRAGKGREVLYTLHDTGGIAVNRHIDALFSDEDEWLISGKFKVISASTYPMSETAYSRDRNVLSVWLERVPDEPGQKGVKARVHVRPYIREGHPVSSYERFVSGGAGLKEGFDADTWFHVTPVERAPSVLGAGLAPPTEGPDVATAPHADPSAIYLWPTRRDAEMWIHFAKNNWRHKEKGFQDYRVLKVRGTNPRQLSPDPEVFDYILRYAEKTDGDWRPHDASERHLYDALDHTGFWEEGHVGGPVHLTLRQWLDQQPDKEHWFWAPATPHEQPPSWFDETQPYRGAIDVLRRMPPMLRMDVARWVSLNPEKLNSIMYYGGVPAANLEDVTDQKPRKPRAFKLGSEVLVHSMYGSALGVVEQTRWDQYRWKWNYTVRITKPLAGWKETTRDTFEFPAEHVEKPLEGRSQPEFPRGARVFVHGRGSSYAGLDVAGTVEKRRWNRWYAQHEYLVRLDQPREGWPAAVWFRADDLDRR